MNQLYHVEGTRLFFELFKDKLVFVTNNEINENFNWTSQDIGEPTEYYQAMKALLFPDQDSKIQKFNNLFDSFYTTRPKDRKPFDVLSAYALVTDDTTNHTRTAYLYYNDTYGLTVISEKQDDNIESTVTTALKNKIDAIKQGFGLDGLTEELSQYNKYTSPLFPLKMEVSLFITPEHMRYPQRGGARSRKARGARPKSSRSTPQRTDMTHVDDKGVKRVVYVKGSARYIKVKRRNGTFRYKKVTEM